MVSVVKISTLVRRKHSCFLLLPFSCTLFLIGCSADFYQGKADAETTAVLFKKTSLVDNVEDDSLEIGTRPEWSSSNLSKNKTQDSSFLGERAEIEKKAKVISLDEALQIGITHSRRYIAEKESVFLEALDLTLAEHRLAPIFGGGADITRRSDSRSANVQNGLTDLVATNTFARDQNLSFNRLYKTGARLSADFTQDFLNFLTGSRDINNSALAVTLVQPLLRGGGQKATLEALTQADRNVLYALRDFANFRREFIVDLVSDYYGVLQARDNVLNAHLAYDGFLENMEREQAFEEVGRRSKTELGQLEQALLSSESRWLSSIRTYETRVDQFKLTLGIPVEDNLVLEDAELKKLTIERPNITRDQAVKIALITRPDLATSRNRIEDADRQIEVAKVDLKPGLGVRVDYTTVSNPGDRTPDLNLDRRNISTGLDVDLPLDRKSERNTYRAALITKELRTRQHEENQDQVRLQVYDDWRSLELAERSYKIANEGVELALTRVEEQRLLFELGRGEVRDLVDAQNDLVNAQNERTSALIDHTLARLRLWRDLGILYIKKDGTWVERLKQEASVTARKLQ